MPLRRLVLLNIVHQNLHPAAHATVIQIKPEAANLNRLSAAFMLARIYARVELVKYLVVAREQRLLNDLFVPMIDQRFNG